MELNHIALYVNDLGKMKLFYEKYFNTKANKMYNNPKTGLKTYFLEFNSSCRIEITNKEKLSNVTKEINSVGYINIAFSAGGKNKVDELTELLENDWYRITSKPGTTEDGYYESCIIDPEGNQIEIVE
ncbi:MAG: VOC family protein [Treponema sp.]|jgi:lactoylglutathione lyase|nr:VOC family protein [Treponema sp.]